MKISNNNYSNVSFGIKISNTVKNKLTKTLADGNKSFTKIINDRIEEMGNWDFPNLEIVIGRTEPCHNDCFAVAKTVSEGTVVVNLKSGAYKRNLLNKFLNIHKEEIAEVKKELDYKIKNKIFIKQNEFTNKSSNTGYSKNFSKLFDNISLY